MRNSLGRADNVRQTSFGLDRRREAELSIVLFSSKFINVPAEVKEQIRLEVAHILFIDTVGYSKLSINEQRAVVDELTTIVRGSGSISESRSCGSVDKNSNRRWHGAGLLHHSGSACAMRG